MRELLIGQVRVTFVDDGHELRHRDDADRAPESLSPYHDAEDAVALALSDDAGAYRPLKTAPNLRHGWRLVLPDARALRLALDLFYPARMAAWERWQQGALAVTPLRDTLNRQTGMYRVAGRLTDDQSDTLVGHFCRSDGGCLRTILWRRDAAGSPASRQLPREKFDPAHDQWAAAGSDADFVPLLCQEACNLLVAEARAVVKGTASTVDQGA